MVHHRAIGVITYDKHINVNRFQQLVETNIDHFNLLQINLQKL